MVQKTQRSQSRLLFRQFPRIKPVKERDILKWYKDKVTTYLTEEIREKSGYDFCGRFFKPIPNRLANTASVEGFNENYIHPVFIGFTE